jgi:hypothetical protein
MSAIRSRSSFICENAGKNTCCSGAAMRENGIRMTVVASAYVPNAAAPRTRPIRTLISVLPACQSMFSAKTLPAKPPSRRRLAIENVNDGRQGVNTHSRAVEVHASASSWPTIAPGAAVDDRDRDADGRAHERGRDLRSSSFRNSHVAHEQRHLGRAESADQEAGRERRRRASGRPVAVEAGQSAGGGGSDEREYEADACADQKTVERSPGTQVASLDQRRAERIVREHDDEAGEDEHHRREAPVVRGEQPGEDERNASSS